jgi:N-acetylmuramoyl-L-alanine amidase
VKVKVGKMLAGKTVNWSMTAQFTPFVVTSGVGVPPEVLGPDPDGPRFRGKWAHAATVAHLHRFSPSTAYQSAGLGGNFSFANLNLAADANGDLPEGGTESSHDRATTTVDPDGYTAIRVNLPPIGFNKARVSIQIAGFTPIDLLDLEVPAVVVIDPGHGRLPIRNNSSAGTTGLFSEVRECDTVLDIGNRAIAKIRKISVADQRLLKVYSTKTPTAPRENVAMANRLARTRQYGADTTVSLHFDGATEEKNGKIALYRNPFAMIDMDNNVYNRNPRADWALGLRIRKSVQQAISTTEPTASVQESATAYQTYNNAHPQDQAEILTSEINEARLQHGLWAIHDGTAPIANNGNYKNEGPPEIRYVPNRATLIEIERIHNKQADLLYNGNTSYNAATGETVLTSTANSVRQETAENIARASVNDILVRDLAAQTAIPVRRNDDNVITGLLDYEND